MVLARTVSDSDSKSASHEARWCWSGENSDCRYASKWAERGAGRCGLSELIVMVQMNNVDLVDEYFSAGISLSGDKAPILICLFWW